MTTSPSWPVTRRVTHAGGHALCTCASTGAGAGRSPHPAAAAIGLHNRAGSAVGSHGLAGVPAALGPFPSQDSGRGPRARARIAPLCALLRDLSGYVSRQGAQDGITIKHFGLGCLAYRGDTRWWSAVRLAAGGHWGQAGQKRSPTPFLVWRAINPLFLADRTPCTLHLKAKYCIL